MDQNDSNSNLASANDNLTINNDNHTKPSYYKPKKTENFVNRNANAESLDFDSMSREELISQGKRLQSHVFQLKNLLKKARNGESSADNQNDFKNKKMNKKRNTRLDKQFDFSKFNKRHVLIKFAYLGWNYHLKIAFKGYTTQEGINNTVEHELFGALIRTKLIESRETSNYHRCGRTDKGVSAFSQIISIDLRSNCASGMGVIQNPQSSVTNADLKNEIDYVKILNGALPDSIRVFCWAPVDAEKSARFDCTKRIYRYYFPKGDLDIGLMSDGAKRLIGEKDYRNFCKMDVSNGVVVFFRRIDNISIAILDKEPNIYSTCELIVEGSSFLWHQIRCIVAVLFLIGQKKEPPSVIDDLLDIEKYSSKPQYQICSEHPLVLFDCQYENVDWIFERGELERVIKHFQDLWLQHQTQATIVKRMIDSLENTLDENKTAMMMDKRQKLNPLFTNLRNLDQPYTSLQGRNLSLAYIKFGDRIKSKSLDEKVEHYVKRQRLDANVYNKIDEANKLAKSLNIYRPNHGSNKPVMDTDNQEKNIDE